MVDRKNKGKDAYKATDLEEVQQKKMVAEFSNNAYVNRSAGLEIDLNSEVADSSTDDDSNDKDLSERERERRKQKKERKAKKGKKGHHDDEAPGDDEDNSSQEGGSKFENKLDLIYNLNSAKLLMISEQFDEYPGQEVDVQQFCDIMVNVMRGRKVAEREDFIELLVDLFFRANKARAETIKFEAFTAFLIEHEIEMAGSGMQQQAKSAGTPSLADMYYYPAQDIVDHTNHNSFIEKIHYIREIDKVLLYEQNMRTVRIYDGSTMIADKAEIPCPGVVLAIEFCTDRDAIAISVSNRTIVFHDIQQKNYKKLKTLHVPSTQKCLAYIQRKKTLFSAGVDGAIFAWNVEKLFSNDLAEMLAQQNQQINLGGGHGEKDDDEGQKQKQKDLEKREYIHYITERTPWFVGDIVLCLTDLPNINQLATGDYDKKIRLWDLRTNSVDQNQLADANYQPETQSQKLKNAAKRKNLKKNKLINDYFRFEVADDLLEDTTKQPVKSLEGHQKAVREIAYSAQQKILISCGFDFEVFIWNPYLLAPIISLKGHDQPLVGVNVLAAQNCFITADAKGTVKVWSILDYSCHQTFIVPNISALTCIRAVPKHRRLICGSRKFIVYQYNKPFMPEFSDDNHISCAIFSEMRFEIYVAGERSIKIWNAKTGAPVRVLKNCLKSEITCMSLDDEHRKLIVGSDQGELKVFDINSGINTHDLNPHDPQEGEISYIGYGGADHTIITIGWDQVIQVHMDCQTEHKKPQSNSKGKRENPQNVLRGKVNCHKKDIIAGAFARHLDLIATGGRDNIVKLWDYERVMLVHEYKAHEAEVSLVRFLEPFPLLLSSDSSGLICIWLTKPHELAGRLVATWRNTLNLTSCTPISAIDSYYNAETSEFLLFQGDEIGEVRVQDISILLEKVPNLQPVALDATDKKRNPHRVFDVDFSQVGKHQPQGGQGQHGIGGMKSESQLVGGQAASDLNGATSASATGGAAAISQMQEQPEPFDLKNEPVFVDESQIIQKGSWKAHNNDVIKSIQYIPLTVNPIIMTASADQFVHIWQFPCDESAGTTSTLNGTLKQGYWQSPDYKWDFQLSNQADLQQKRSTKVHSLLSEVRTMRDENMSSKRRQEIQAIKEKSRGPLSFAGTQLLGMKSNMIASSSQPGQSQYEDNSIFNQNRRRMADLCSKGRQFLEHEQFLTKRKNEHAKAIAQAGGGPDAASEIKMDVSYAAFKDMLKEKEQKESEKAARMIGPFMFDNDDFIDMEVLTSDQVYADLVQLDEILGKNLTEEQEMSAKGALNKTKRKR